MRFRQLRIRLIQVAASVAILVLPFALYGPVLREGLGRLSSRVLVSLVSHCIELEAFFWLVLTPAVLSGLGRWHGSRAATLAPLSDRIALAVGPCLAVFLPIAGWGEGYRLPGFSVLEEAAFLLAFCNVPLLLPLAYFWSKRSAPITRSVATVVLLLLAIPCIGSAEQAAKLGRRRLEHELDFARLARDCLRLVETHGKPEDRE